MSTYGRNFEFRIPPVHAQRHGRYKVPATGTKIPLGAPIMADTAVAVDSLGLQQVKLAPADTARGAGGTKGILVYEYAPAAYAGDDPFLTTPSDKDVAPLGAAVQLCAGVGIKVVFRNTVDETFLNTRSYTGRTFVAGLGATPTLAVGDFLLPGTGDDTSGYWKETSTEADAWLVITKVDTSRKEVEAEMLF